jgi:hypothetical protein
MIAGCLARSMLFRRLGTQHWVRSRGERGFEHRIGITQAREDEVQVGRNLSVVSPASSSGHLAKGDFTCKKEPSAKRKRTLTT